MTKRFIGPLSRRLLLARRPKFDSRHHLGVCHQASGSAVMIHLVAENLIRCPDMSRNYRSKIAERAIDLSFESALAWDYPEPDREAESPSILCGCQVSFCGFCDRSRRYPRQSLPACCCE